MAMASPMRTQRSDFTAYSDYDDSRYDDSGCGPVPVRSRTANPSRSRCRWPRCDLREWPLQSRSWWISSEPRSGTPLSSRGISSSPTYSGTVTLCRWGDLVSECGIGEIVTAVGIGMAPVNPLDITKTQSAWLPSSLLLNGHTGTKAIAEPSSISSNASHTASASSLREPASLRLDLPFRDNSLRLSSGAAAGGMTIGTEAGANPSDWLHKQYVEGGSAPGERSGSLLVGTTTNTGAGTIYAASRAQTLTSSNNRSFWQRLRRAIVS